MRIESYVEKTRNIGGFTMEMQVAFIKNENVYQATYYKGADDFIWSGGFPTKKEAIDALDSIVDEYAKSYPLSYGSKEIDLDAEEDEDWNKLIRSGAMKKI